MKRNRTPQRPMIDCNERPLSPKWEWSVFYEVASSGYATRCHVTAKSGPGHDPYIGTAACAVQLHDDLREVIECLAIEAMLAACEPTLDGSPTHRNVVFASNL